MIIEPNDKKHSIIVIGGGAAGMIAAIIAMRTAKTSRANISVTLLEKNQSLGKKLLLTGKGRCNLTNASDIDEIIRNIIGTIVSVGLGRLSVDDFEAVLHAHNRQKASPTAPAWGLYLSSVEY